MQCPSCKKTFHPQPDKLKTYQLDDFDSSISIPNAIEFSIQQCPSCDTFILIKKTGFMGFHDTCITTISDISIIYPLVKVERLIPPEVPEDCLNEYREAESVFSISPKSSAALSRRLLQKILHEKLQIRKKDLSLEIEEFINTSNAPTYLIEAIDAVRQIGNFAAHPIKYTNTAEIVEVESGEAEWLLDVLESFFDFVFVQPKKLELRRDALNNKLVQLGKPMLKGS